MRRLLRRFIGASLELSHQKVQPPVVALHRRSRGGLWLLRLAASRPHPWRHTIENRRRYRHVWSRARRPWRSGNVSSLTPIYALMSRYGGNRAQGGLRKVAASRSSGMRIMVAEGLANLLTLAGYPSTKPSRTAPSAQRTHRRQAAASAKGVKKSVSNGLPYIKIVDLVFRLFYFLVHC